jgi:plasmid stabilization system protein ParE
MEAVEELEKATDWYAADSQETAQKWRRAVRETLNSIRQSPELWAPDRTGIRKVLINPFSY